MDFDIERLLRLLWKGFHRNGQENHDEKNRDKQDAEPVNDGDEPG